MKNIDKTTTNQRDEPCPITPDGWPSDRNYVYRRYPATLGPGEELVSEYWARQGVYMDGPGSECVTCVIVALAMDREGGAR